jgi:Transcription factor WhiB
VSALWESLLGAMAGVPRLDGARCAGDRTGIWDSDQPDDVEHCRTVCRSCPALASCQEYADDNEGFLSGVVGGELRVWRARARREAKAS